MNRPDLLSLVLAPETRTPKEGLASEALTDLYKRTDETLTGAGLPGLEQEI